MWYTATCKFMEGLTTRGAFVTFRSRATTRRGLLRAMARAVVDSVGTDCFEMNRKVLKSPKNDGTGKVFELTSAECHEVWRMGHELMMGA